MRQACKLVLGMPMVLGKMMVLGKLMVLGMPMVLGRQTVPGRRGLLDRQVRKPARRRRRRQSVKKIKQRVKSSPNEMSHKKTINRI
jgi:hypothetical protein